MTRLEWDRMCTCFATWQNRKTEPVFSPEATAHRIIDFVELLLRAICSGTTESERHNKKKLAHFRRISMETKLNDVLGHSRFHSARGPQGEIRDSLHPFLLIGLGSLYFGLYGDFAFVGRFYSCYLYADSAAGIDGLPLLPGLLGRRKLPSKCFRHNHGTDGGGQFKFRLHRVKNFIQYSMWRCQRLDGCSD